MRLTDKTPITIQYPEGEYDETRTTWAAFVASNDAETVETVREQVEQGYYATLGGGAAPIVWIFA